MAETSKLLLVDDEPGLREAVQAYLESEDEFEVEVASNAKQAWELVQKDPPDLVISDIMMPDVDGYQFLKQLREDPRFKSLPVVFLTARGMTSDRIQGYQAGCDAYLPKPFDPDELVAIVHNLLERRAVSAETGDSSELEKIAREIADIKNILGQNSGIAQTPSPIKIELTPREQSVLDLVAQGLMNKEIASRLKTSVRNVEKYVSRLFSKTGTNSRTELVRFALKHGLTT
ncbi:MAG: response regulator transcription factor [Oscillatoria sp. PMC 1051.18]|uniref:response regulator transcription factor n=1 Tax=Oscillatoria salina TaxID=331517 RepID=UPI0013B84549|nr:response regulator transcription factor [Oscillatoria salina]MBZ8182307.1 response regulator transcription factor [Oscillatoria salina IIICB1]MEC4893728.1 response regulator transcription factor [Oscillatoria sp. PMC 1050.18]MEC5030503.1 response regulator transcription factor [Oscillatoria sp. PMC 1051.18]NET90568.1 response regulator transcription factor [Kamptonema sp. SIO1D9]